MQPEWFYKGDGSTLVAPGGDSPLPNFALDGAGEEPEIVGIYRDQSAARRCGLGFALGNEFSDHVTERQNYLYLAHSKLRASSFGPELLLGDLPADIQGASRIRRGKDLLWEKPFISGEQNMSHTIANLEAHHFKYELFRRPRRRACAFLRHRDLVLLGRNQAGEGRRVRDRSGSLRPTAAQPADDRQSGEGEGASAFS